MDTLDSVLDVACGIFVHSLAPKDHVFDVRRVSCRIATRCLAGSVSPHRIGHDSTTLLSILRKWSPKP